MPAIPVRCDSCARLVLLGGVGWHRCADGRRHLRPPARNLQPADYAAAVRAAALREELGEP